jgi:hypothetical protein
MYAGYQSGQACNSSEDELVTEVFTKLPKWSLTFTHDFEVPLILR